MFPAVIETERLRLEAVGPDAAELDRVYEICAHDEGIEDVTRCLPWEPHETIRETEQFLADGAERWADGQSADYVVRPRESADGVGEVAGFGGLYCDWERDRAALGLWLRKRFWGRGYSGERATALVELAFDRLGLGVVQVGHLDGNEKSESAISEYVDRLGGRREGIERNSLAFPDGEVHTEASYTITRAEWLDATDGGTDVLD
ncbi:MAG: GNAT family N-acetyltransferase [Halobaculum sp.]